MSEFANPNPEAEQSQLQQRQTLQPVAEDAECLIPTIAPPQRLLTSDAETEVAPERGRALARRADVEVDDKQEVSSPSTSSPNEAAILCAICHEALENRAMIYPCVHVFDLECVSTWLAQPGRGSRKCPLCRRVIEEIHHDFDGEGRFRRQAIDAMEEGDFPSDEELTPNTSQRERHAALERRRLRARAPLMLRGDTPYVNICVGEDEYCVRIKREVVLEIEQRDLVTISKIIRTVQIKYTDRDRSLYHTEWDNSYKNMLELERTKREVERMTNRWLNPFLGVQEGTFVLHNVEIPRGYRGIHSFLRGRVIIESTKRDPKSVKIVWETTLEEEGPANANSDLEILPLHARSESRTRREEHIANAVEQINSTLDWFQTRQLDVSEWRQIERATTNILEPCRSDPGCRYCNQGHRNGDCLLRWEHARVVVGGPTTPGPWNDWDWSGGASGS